MRPRTLRPAATARRRARPHIERLEDRTVPSVSLIESFEGGNLNSYRSILHYLPAAHVVPAAAHDGDPGRGLLKHDGYEWLFRTDAAAQVRQGQRLSVWVQFAGAADGRAYIGFGATAAGPTQDASANRTLSLVLAANTNQLILQNNSGMSHLAISAVSQTYQANRWYRAEITWATGGAITGRLYDSDGVTLLNTVTGTNTAITSGGIAFRAFGSAKYFDTVVLDDNASATPAEITAVGGGLPPTWTPGTPPPPRTNGPSTPPGTPVPWQYTSMPGTGRDIMLLEYNGLIQVQLVSGTVTLAGQNISRNVGTVSIDWGPAFGTGAPATPLLAQYLFRQRPGESTRLIGTSSDVKHFFAPSIVNPNQDDLYATSHNSNQADFTPGAEVDPVLGLLHRPSHIGPMDNDGINQRNNHSHQPLDHLLQVPVADLDPAQNPPGTRWFIMANVFVEGDQNVANNSRWLEIVPVRNPTTGNFTFNYPSGPTGQLDFRTIPGLPRIIDDGDTGFSASGWTETVDALAFARDVRTADPTGGPRTATYSFTGLAPGQYRVAATWTAGPNRASNVLYTIRDGSNVLATGRFSQQTAPADFSDAGFMWRNLGGLHLLQGTALTVELSTDGTDGLVVADAVRLERVSGFRVLQGSPAGTVAPAVSSYQVTFSQPVNAATFDASDITLTGPAGPIAVTNITQNSPTQYTLTFAVQDRAGTYTVAIGPQIQDIFGRGMDQNDNGIPGESTDVFTGNFVITGPRVISQTPTGRQTGPVSSLRVVFDRLINASTLTAADVNFTNPFGEPITLTAITPSSGQATQFDLTFPAQNDIGGYTLVLGPDVRDTFGNAMDQNGNGITLEIPADRYTGGFSIGSYGPEGFGYFATAVAFENLDLNPGDAGVVSILGSVDDGTAGIDLGGNTFNFYGTTYTGNNQLFVSSNGLITFGSANSAFTNSDLTAEPPETAIAVLWDDWVTNRDATDQVLYKFDDVTGDGTPDRLIIEWQVYHISVSTGDLATFQAILHLNTGAGPGAVYLNFPDLVVGNSSYDNGASATTGIKAQGPQGPNRLLINQNSGTNPDVQSGRTLRVTAAGATQFRFAGFSVDENAGVATVTVSRVAGSFGNVSVRYATSNGTATAGQDYAAVSGTLTFTAGQMLNTFTVPILDDSVFEGDETVNLALSNPTNGAVLGNPSTALLTIRENDPAPLQVTVTRTNAGFTADFNLPFDPAPLNLYNTQAGGMGPADITLVGNTTGPVRGSVVLDSTNRRLTFIKTGGPLPADTYTVTLRSAADGFRTVGGTLLDGNNDGAPGGDAIRVFTVPPFTNTPVVSLPDFARGPGQTVELPAGVLGLPLQPTSAGGVTSINLTLRYPSTLLQVTGGSVAPGLPEGSEATIDVSTPGQVGVQFNTFTELPAGTIAFVRLTATVPANATYGQKGVLELTGVEVNGVSAIGDAGLHAVVYPGDASGNARYSAADALRTLQTAVGLADGFSAHRLADPVVIADVTGNGVLNSADATRILQEALGIDRPEIPPLPANPPTVTAPGVDPLLSIPSPLSPSDGERGKGFRARRGRVVSVPVNLDMSEGLESADLAISYDTSRLEVVEVRRGSLTHDFDLFAVHVDPVAGTIRAGLGRSAGAVSDRGPGSVLWLVFRVKARAPAGRAIINLRAGLGPTTTQLNEGQFDLNPDPSDLAGDAVDGQVMVGRRDGRAQRILARDLVFAEWQSRGFDLVESLRPRKRLG